MIIALRRPYTDEGSRTTADCARVLRCSPALVLQFVPLLATLFWALGLIGSESAYAGSPTCSMSSSTISFGNVNVLPGTAIDTTATITVSCSGGSGTGHRLCISIGSGTDFSGSQRQLRGAGAATLNYELYRDAGRTAPWGSWQTGFGGTGLQYDIPQYGTASITVYGRLAASQNTAPVGTYATAFTANPYMQYDDKGSASCPTGGRSTSTSTSADATVLSSCTVSATNMNFGTTGILSSIVNAASQLSPTCNNGLPYTIALNGGQASATDPTQRKMSKGAEQITYGLYRDSGRSQGWGSTIGTNTLAASGTGSAQAVPIYGRVPAQSTGSPGTYTDTIVATINY